MGLGLYKSGNRLVLGALLRIKALGKLKIHTKTRFPAFQSACLNKPSLFCLLEIALGLTDNRQIILKKRPY